MLELLLGPDGPAHAHRLGWDRPEFLRRVTGRTPLDGAEVAMVERLGIRWLTLG